MDTYFGWSIVGSFAAVLEPVYRADSNSAVRKGMWVRLPPAAPSSELGILRCNAHPPEPARCVDERLLGDEYVYLLGLYLGDGCLSASRRAVWKLRVTLDERYPSIIEGCARAIVKLTGRRPGISQRVGCIEVYSYWKHWPCLFPQHGPGPKHTRQIRLTAWQRELVTVSPEALLVGLIHSDGCRTMNRAKGRLYPRYQFSNRSSDIRALFSEACQLVGVDCRTNNRYSLSVARRGSVEILDRMGAGKR